MSQKLLLHACCAPCSIAVIDELRHAYDVTVFFYNPNLFPDTEYEKRKREVVRVCGEWGIPMIDGDHESAVWEELVGGVRQEREGGPRCAACTLLRLSKTAERALADGFELFATSLTSSSRKNATVINAQGQAVGRAKGLEFLDKDWKKDGHTEKGRQMVAERKIYRQNYCGCRFSYQEMLERQKQKAESAG